MADEVRAPAVDLPDDLINSFLDGGDGAGKDDSGEEEETTTDETGTEDDETQDGQLDSEEDGTEDEVGEEDDDSDEDDDDNEEDEDSEGDGQEEDEDSETDDDDEEEDTFLSKELLKKHQKEIEKNPHLKAIYKSMQRDYTQKTMEVAKHRGAYEEANQEYEDFASTLADVEEGGGREMFLVDAALDNPEAFQRAYDRAVELLESPDAKKKYERERDVDQRAKRIEAKEKAEAKRTQQARVTEIHSTAESYAKRYGIKGERGLKVAKKYVAQVILENRTAKRHQDVFITDEQIREAVKDAALDIGEQRSDAADETGRKLRKQRLEDVKKTARNSKRRAAPGGKRTPTSSSAKPPKKLPQGTDPLDARIDQLLG